MPNHINATHTPSRFFMLGNDCVTIYHNTGCDGLLKRLEKPFDDMGALLEVRQGMDPVTIIADFANDEGSTELKEEEFNVIDKAIEKARTGTRITV